MQNINWQPDTLETNEVKLAPLQEKDFDALYAVGSDPLIWEQHPSSDRYQKNVFQDFFNDAIKSGTAFVIIDQSNGQIIGSTRYYDYDESNSSIAIGFTFLARSYWGGRFNRLIKRLMLDYAFRYVDKVLFHIGPNNLRSQIATGRTGAKKTSEFYKDAINRTSLSYEFTLNKSEWSNR